MQCNLLRMAGLWKAGRIRSELITARSSPDMSGIMNAACGMKGPTSAATGRVVWY